MENQSPAENPWLRPGFLVSSCVVVLIVALGIYVCIVTVTGRHQRTGSAASTHPVPGRSAAGDGRTRCGLPASSTSDAVVDLRATTWRYSTAMAYPTSSEYGPGRTSEQGFRYCFQDSAGGALFAAANSLAFDNANASEARAWSEYMLAEGPYRQQRLSDDYVQNDPNIRLQIIGYRILSYTDTRALIDIAARASTPAETMIISCVSDLVWQRGDWRFSTAVPDPVNVVRVGDITGYAAWSAD